MEYYAIVNSKSFEHHGTPGQKWGVRRAEWYPIDKYKEHLQNMGYSDRIIKKKMRKAEIGERKYQKQVAKTKAKNLAKAKKVRQQNLAIKKEKEEIIRTGDIESALKRIDDFTNAELKTIQDRNSAKIAITQAKTDAMISKLNTMSNVIQKTSNMAENGLKIYNVIAKVANGLGDSNLPIFENNNNNNQQKNNNNNQNNNSNNQQNNNQQKKKDNNKNNSNNQKEKDLNSKIDKDIEDRMKKMDKQNKKDSKEAAKDRKAEREWEWSREDPEHVSGTVENDSKNKSSNKAYEKAARAAEDIIIDAVWRDITSSNVSNGERYVQNQISQMNYPLLELKKNK